MSVKKYDIKQRELIKKAGNLAARALDYVCSFVQAGVSTQFLDDKFVEFLKNNGGSAACLGYYDYPKHICVSVNEVICHGIPSDRVLQDGDVVSVDLVVELDGYYGDTCRTVIIGSGSARNKLLVDITYKALYKAIDSLRIGMLFKEIGKVIEEFVTPYRLHVVKEYCGHGIGDSLHQPPQILHYWNKNEPDIAIEEGMCFTIEPMIVVGNASNKTLADQWTVVTKDKSVCAQFEHTILMEKDHAVICTQY